MLEKFLSYWNYGSTYFGLEYTTQAGEPRFLAVSAEKKKGEFENLNFFEASGLDELKKKLKQMGK